MSKNYVVTEIFHTLQGEGLWSGRPAVFMRLAGCNQWNGIPADRHKGSGACAMWCDTNFAKGSKMDLETVLTQLDAAWATHSLPEPGRMVVISGGEPTLQIDEALIVELKRNGWFVAIETNGTIDNPALALCDHVCVSPKRGSELLVWTAAELKVILPGGIPGGPIEHQWSNADLEYLSVLGIWSHKFVQPQDITEASAVEQTYLHTIRTGKPGEVPSGAGQFESNVQTCIDFIGTHPGWRLSYQVHKILGVK